MLHRKAVTRHSTVGSCKFHVGNTFKNIECRVYENIALNFAAVYEHSPKIDRPGYFEQAKLFRVF